MWESVLSSSVSESIENSHLTSIDSDSVIAICAHLQNRPYAEHAYIVIGMGHFSVCFNSYEVSRTDPSTSISIAKENNIFSASLPTSKKSDKKISIKYGTLHEIIDFIDLFAIKTQFLK